ncbi:MAG: cytidylate kinase-like family protein [Nitrospiraceae bacterium]|nr:cytidylate kinase-like family protein [Nitrospiraceae bacterium]
MGKILITISRQFASGGAYIGQSLARRFSCAYFDREILRRAAEQLDEEEARIEKREERLSGFFEDVIRPFIFGSPETAYMPPPLRPVDDRDLFRAEAAIIRQLAKKYDAVFVGRCASHVLREEPGLVNIFLHARMEFRVKQAMEAYGVSADEAAGLIEKSDHDRRKFISAMTGADWTDVRNYHLAIDTGRTGFKTAEEMVRLLVEEVRAKIGGAKS